MEAITEDIVLKELLKISKEDNEKEAIKILIIKYYEAKLAYWEMVDKFFTQKKGMDFQTYEDTKHSEWDGDDWQLCEEFHDWEGAIASLQFYKKKWEELKEWRPKSLNDSYSNI
ncbi:MAG: hypothetical protein H7A25_10465 [Leptospiraceae bacterium]|nr:hypothetical protein [Leptospiraceae bacterium]